MQDAPREPSPVASPPFQYASRTALGDLLVVVGHERPVGTFPLASDAGRECVVHVDQNDLTVLITPVASSRAALTRFEGPVWTKRSISRFFQPSHLLS